MVPRAERLEKVKEILGDALELPAEEQLLYVERACGDDVAVCAEVLSLLAHERDLPPWAEGPLVRWPDLPLDGLEEEGVARGERIGPYRIEDVIGAGGMGTVFLAVREDDFEKKVAVKVVHSRLSRELIRRFHRERQIVAQLEHPNIARLLDGGTAQDGRPYLVLELVRGEPIDVFCERRGLDLRERLQLVLQVCAALELAHRNLIVHRDIKPSNILVTDDGVPKLLDFGIAKRIEADATELTRQRERPMTLRYASPEQIDGGAISTATDVYGLGLLLYRLFAGRLPFAAEEASESKLAEAICSQTPRRPSSVVEDLPWKRELVGDLDAIVGKALRKEPEQRYGSVGQLADDLRRFLEGRPVLARQGTGLYVAGRFVRRHRWALGAATFLLLLSLAFGITATVLWRRAEIAREQAVEGQRQKERALVFLKEIFRGVGPNRARGQRDRTAFELLAEAEARLPAEDENVQTELLATLGQMYAEWGMSDESGRAWKRAEGLLRRRYPEGHPDLAKAINNVASWHLRREEYAAAAGLYREALAMKRRFPDSPEADIAKAMSNLATALMESGDEAEVEGLYRGALAIRRAEVRPDFDDIAQTLRNLGVFHHQRNDLGKAEALMREALEACEQAHPAGKHTQYATILNGLARVIEDRGRPGEALPLMRQALEIRTALLGGSHLHVTSSWIDLASVYRVLGQREKGRSLLDRARAWLDQEEPDRYGRYRAGAESLLGAYLLAEGRYQEAETSLDSSRRWLAAHRPEADRDRRRAESWWTELVQARAGSRPARVVEPPPR